MKKIISIIALVALFASSLASCAESVPDFVPVQELSGLYVASGMSKFPKEIDTAEYREKIVEAYCSVTETKAYVEDAKAEWQLVMVGKDKNDPILITGIGDGKFNVSVSSRGIRYMVENEKLDSFVKTELMNVKELSVNVTVVVALEDGTELDRTNVTVTGTETEKPTVVGGVYTGIKAGKYAEDSKFSSAKRLIGIGDYAETVNPGDDGVERLYWRYYLEDEELENDLIGLVTLKEGDVLKVVYVKTFIAK